MKSSNPEYITYEIARNVYGNTISKEDGINKLAAVLNMNKGSAKMIIVQISPKLMNGELFTRTLSIAYFDGFLKCIIEDYGTEKLKLALSALKMHMDYSLEKGDPKIGLRKVYEKYLDDLTSVITHFDRDEIEQEEISKFYQKNKTRAETIEELKNSKDVGNEKVTVNHKSYKRNNKTIALIKILRGFECQICGFSILKRDGTKYVEAAHILAKRKNGKESPDNIILLCPNHHKEFDLGNPKIIKHSADQVQFELYGKQYKVSLATDL